MQELISLSTRLVVMTEHGRHMLRDVYCAPSAKIDLIAHGIPDVGFVEPDGTVKVYWGGADTVMCAGEANISDLVTLCLEHGRPAK